jgi:hypothetical protein
MSMIGFLIDGCSDDNIIITVEENKATIESDCLKTFENPKIGDLVKPI